MWIFCCSSQTFVNLSSYVHVSYTQGSWSGFLASDVVRITSLANLSAFHSNIAMITESSDFFVNGSMWQGILGLAFSVIAQVNCFCFFVNVKNAAYCFILSISEVVLSLMFE